MSAVMLDCSCYLTMVSTDKMDSAIDKWTSPGENQGTRRTCLKAKSLQISHGMTYEWTYKATCGDVRWHVMFSDNI
jgi:hypothetical protein